MAALKWIRPSFLLISLSSLLIACGGGSSNESPVIRVDPPVTVEEIENDIGLALDQVTAFTDFTLLIQAKNGHSFSYSVGNSTESSVYRSASTSKMVTAAVILNLVNDGVLSLEDNPQNFIPNWPTTGNLSQIQLRHLLSFTSGLNNEPTCMNNPFTTLASCAEQTLQQNTGAPIPGTEFYYASTHMQIAGLMAVNASGADSWQAVFDEFKTETGLFAGRDFDLPSIQNPRLAGGMHWAATDYLGFLQTLYEGSILTPTLIDEMTRNQLQAATVVYSPVSAAGRDWRYGFGNWIECDNNPFDCTETTLVSSAGAYGAYPFIDFQWDYFGIISREGRLGSSSETIPVFQSIEALLQEWALLNQI